MRKVIVIAAALWSLRATPAFAFTATGMPWDGPFQTLLNGISENLSKFRVYIFKYAILDEIDAYKRLICKIAKLFFRFLERLLHPLSLGDVMANTQHADELAVTVIHWRLNGFKDFTMPVICKSNFLFVSDRHIFGHCTFILNSEKIRQFLIY